MAQGRVGMAADVSAVAMTADLGAEIRGIDLAAPLSDACFRRIVELFHRYCVVFLRNQSLEPRLLIRFAARFGETDSAPSDDRSIPGLPQVSILGGAHGSADAGSLPQHGIGWRTDGASRSQLPLATLLYAVQCPPQGGTIEFVNLYSVFSALPRERQLFLEKLRTVHELIDRPAAPRPGFPSSVPQPDEQARTTEHLLVRMHPVTRRKALYFTRDCVSRVMGLAPDEGRKLLDELEAFASQPRFVYSHRWRKGDLIIWDSRCTVYRMTPFERKQERILHRVRVKGELPAPACRSGRFSVADCSAADMR